MQATELSTYTIGDTVEDFVLADVDGNLVRSSDVTGKWTLVYFTTTWCPYCTAEAPCLESELFAAFEDAGLKLVIIDVKEPAAVARMLPDRFGWKSPFLVDLDGRVAERFAPRKEGLPPEEHDLVRQQQGVTS